MHEETCLDLALVALIDSVLDMTGSGWFSLEKSRRHTFIGFLLGQALSGERVHVKRMVPIDLVVKGSDLKRLEIEPDSAGLHTEVGADEAQRMAEAKRHALVIHVRPGERLTRDTRAHLKGKARSDQT